MSRIEVSVYYPNDLKVSYEQRKSVLVQKFNEVSGILSQYSIEADLSQIGAAGQTLPAQMPEENFAAADKALKSKGFVLIRNDEYDVGL